MNVRTFVNFAPQLMKPRGVITPETRSAAEVLREAADVIEASTVVGDDPPAIDLIAEEHAERRGLLK